MVDQRIEELSEANQQQAAELIRAGLAERWGDVDQGLNTDLDNLTVAYEQGRTILVRRNDGRLLGTGTLVPGSDSTAEIVRMSVARSARRLGIGRLIVDELLVTACDWGADRVILETTSTWTDAVAFYLRCGFSITRRTTDEFGPQTRFEYRLTPTTT